MITREQIEGWRTAEIVEERDWMEVFNLALRGLEATWRPIETAPKDGTRFLAVNVCGRFPYVEVVAWVPWVRAFCTVHGGDVALRAWMPLPSAPEVG